MNTRPNDELLLIDAVLDRLDSDQARQVQERLAGDKAFRDLHRDLTNTVRALELLPACEAPNDLVAKTLHCIRQARQTDALIAREELGRSYRPTFSMREAFAVAASILIIAGVFIPSVHQARRVAQIGQCAANMGQIGSAMLAYSNANDDHLPTAAGVYRQWLPGQGPNVVSNSSALFKIVRLGYSQQTIFLCPSATSGQPFEVNAKIDDFPSGKNIHYSYQHTVGGDDLISTDPAIRNVSAKMAILADRTPFYRDNGSFQTREPTVATSDNHGRCGNNVLYLDMHVEWAKLPLAGVAGNNIFLAEGIYNYKGDETPVSPTDSFLLPAWSASAEK